MKWRARSLAFRNGLLAAQKTSASGEAWSALNSLLTELSETLPQATRSHPVRHSRQKHPESAASRPRSRGRATP
jgi:hypothetical protein